MDTTGWANMTEKRISKLENKIAELKEAIRKSNRAGISAIFRVETNQKQIQKVLREFIKKFVWEYNSGFSSSARAQDWLNLLEKLEGTKDCGMVCQPTPLTKEDRERQLKQYEDSGDEKIGIKEVEEFYDSGDDIIKTIKKEYQQGLKEGKWIEIPGDEKKVMTSEQARQLEKDLKECFVEYWGDEKSDLENECSKEGDARSKSADSKAPEEITDAEKCWRCEHDIYKEFVEKLKHIRDDWDNITTHYLNKQIKEYEAKL